jgi:rod shape-determining protein MreB
MRGPTMADVPVVGRLAKRLAVDVGSSRVRIANPAPRSSTTPGLIELPAVVLVDQARARVVAVGKDAAEVAATTVPPSLKVVYPIQHGVVAEPDLAQAMLAAMWRIARGPMRPSIIAGVPAGANTAQRLLLIGVLLGAGAGRVRLLPRPLAAAHALGLPISGSRPRMIVDIGGGLVDVAVCALNQVAFARCFPFAGDWLDASIARRLRRERGELVPPEMAEQIKCELGSLEATENEQLTFSSIRLTHHTSYMNITAEEVRGAVLHGLDRIAEELNAIWLELDPKTRDAVAADGVTLVGGTLRLKGLVEELGKRLDFPLHPAPDAQLATATIAGLSQVAHAPSRFAAALESQEIR